MNRIVKTKIFAGYGTLAAGIAAGVAIATVMSTMTKVDVVSLLRNEFVVITWQRVYKGWRKSFTAAYRPKLEKHGEAGTESNDMGVAPVVTDDFIEYYSRKPLNMSLRTSCFNRTAVESLEYSLESFHEECLYPDSLSSEDDFFATDMTLLRGGRSTIASAFGTTTLTTRSSDSRYVTGFQSYEMSLRSIIDPSEIEYRPNPVIFSHLTESCNVPREENGTCFAPRPWAQLTGRDAGSEVLPLSDTGRNSEESQRVTDHATLINTETELVSNSTFQLPQEPQWLGLPAIMTVNIDSSDDTPLPRIQSPILNTPADHSSSQTNNQLPASTAETQTRAQPMTTTYTCTDCNLTFDKQFQLTQHINRKHNRRFSCLFCSRSFNLREDLRRHERAKHKSTSLEETRTTPNTWKCEKEGCKVPDLVWTRKDNFRRHQRKCQSVAVK